jgi:tetratricopeptide (TPR) repeat protein
MIRLIPAVFLAALLAAPPARAEPGDAPPILNQRVIAELSRGDLFAKLPENADSPAGERIEQEILRRFARSGSPTADLLMSWAEDAMGKKNYPLALDVLDQVIVVKPDFAEAWNRRATVHFLMDDYGDSLSDIGQTLALEPRHFGALAGFGTILQAMDRNEEAIRVYKRALELDPRLDKVRESLEALEKETGGKDI